MSNDTGFARTGGRSIIITPPRYCGTSCSQQWHSPRTLLRYPALAWLWRSEERSYVVLHRAGITVNRSPGEHSQSHSARSHRRTRNQLYTGARRKYTSPWKTLMPSNGGSSPLLCRGDTIVMCLPLFGGQSADPGRRRQYFSREYTYTQCSFWMFRTVLMIPRPWIRP